MFGIGFGEMIVIGILILIAVGPDKLPVMVRTVAKTYRQFRRAATDIRASTGLDDFLRDEELRELADLRKEKLLAMGKPLPGKPGVAGKPGVGGKPGVAGKPIAEGETMPASKPGASHGMTLKQRQIEMPPQGVDIAEMQAAAIPETRASIETAPTAQLAKPSAGGTA